MPLPCRVSSTVATRWAFVILSLLAFPTIAPAADRVWTGAINNDWGNNGNWETGAPVNGSSDIAAFMRTFTRQPTVSGNFLFGGIWMNDFVGQNVIVGGGAGGELHLASTTIDGIPNLGILVDNTNTAALTINTGVKLGGTQTWLNNSQNLLTIGGTVNTTVYNLTVSGTGNTTISGSLGAGGALTKSGVGTLVLSGANTYSGTTAVVAGVLSLQNSSALGSTFAGTTVNAGAEIQLSGGIGIGGEALTLNGHGTTDEGALRSVSGNNSWMGNITLGSSSTIAATTGNLTLFGGISNGGNGSSVTFGGGGNTLLTGVISSNASVIKNGTGTLTLTGVNTYTGATVVNGGLLHVTGSLNGSIGTALTFGGTGKINFNEAAGTTQGMGTLTFVGGDGTVESTYAGSGNTTLTFSALGPLGVGATGNFVVSGGTNGTTNRIILTGQPTGFINSGTFFGGDNYAYMDPAGFVRGINYGVDPGTVVSNGGVSVSGDHAIVQGHITSQGTQRLDTLHLSSNVNFNLGGQQKVTVNGILKTGNVAGGATITGGDYLQADLNGNMTIRTDKVNDSLTIHAPIVANGTNAVTKSGEGTLRLSGINTYTGGTFVNAGTLEIGSNERLLNTGAVTVQGGTLDVQGFTETVGAVVLSSGAINGTGAGTLIGTSYNVRSGSASAILGGTAALTKTTDGTVTLTGANTYTGATTINDGTLVAAATPGGALANTVSVTVNGDANLVLGADNQINNVASVTLAGGTLTATGFDEGAANLAGAGALNLTAAGSHIDYGTGDTSTLSFAILNPGANLLTIDNWTGTAGVIGNATTDRLIFAADPTSFLDLFSFIGYQPGGMALSLGFGFYEVTPTLTPVPEINPALAVSMLCAGAGVLFWRRRSRQRESL